MIQTTVKVSGMVCSMCEAHINDAIRAAFSVEKVSSSHSKGETVILSQEPSDENVLRAAIDAACYTAGDIQTKTCEKKELFPFLKKQSVIFEEPPSGGFSRAIWLEYANQ